MKKIFPIITITSLLTVQSCGEYAHLFTGPLIAAGAAATEYLAETNGYSQEDAKKFAKDCWGNNENVERGIAYITAKDKYTRNAVIFDGILDNVGTMTDTKETMNYLRRMNSVYSDYNREYSQATTVEEKRAVIKKRDIALWDIGYDACEYKKERKAQYIAEKLRLADEFKGYTRDQALEIAGSILAVQRSKDFTEDEKQKYLSALLPDDSVETIIAVIQDAEVTQYTNQDITYQPSASDLAEIAAAEKEAEQAKVEKVNAINTVKAIIIDSYNFDCIELNDNQKLIMDKIVTVLNQYPDFKIQIKGHACDIGTTSVNDRVGLRRADAAKSYLIGKGVDCNRISTVTGGENEPVVENTSSDNRKKNRRLTFDIY